jgi:hypothetical protein
VCCKTDFTLKSSQWLHLTDYWKRPTAKQDELTPNFLIAREVYHWGRQISSKNLRTGSFHFNIHLGFPPKFQGWNYSLSLWTLLLWRCRDLIVLMGSLMSLLTSLVMGRASNPLNSWLSGDWLLLYFFFGLLSFTFLDLSVVINFSSAFE